MQTHLKFTDYFFTCFKENSLINKFTLFEKFEEQNFDTHTDI